MTLVSDRVEGLPDVRLRLQATRERRRIDPPEANVWDVLVRGRYVGCVWLHEDGGWVPELWVDNDEDDERYGLLIDDRSPTPRPTDRDDAVRIVVDADAQENRGGEE